MSFFYFVSSPGANKRKYGDFMNLIQNQLKDNYKSENSEILRMDQQTYGQIERTGKQTDKQIERLNTHTNKHKDRQRWPLSSRFQNFVYRQVTV